MRSGVMTTGPRKQWHGQPMDVDGYLGLLRSWGVETLDIFPHFFDHCSLKDTAAKLAEHGLETACFYAPADLVSTEPEVMATAAESFKRSIECCAVLNSPFLFTYGSQHTHAGDDDFKRYQDRLVEMLELVAGAGLTFLVENAGSLMYSAQPMADLVAAIDHPQFKLALDTGNFFLWAEDEVAAVEQLLPQTVHFHIKEYARRWEDDKGPHGEGDVLGQGAVRHAPILDMIKRSGYTGTLAFEATGQDEEGYEASVRTLVEWCG